MYSKIEIYNTDFTDKYLLKVEDKTMYVGFLIKEVVELLKENKTINQIINILNSKHQIDLKEEDINEIVTTISSINTISLSYVMDKNKIKTKSNLIF